MFSKDECTKTWQYIHWVGFTKLTYLEKRLRVSGRIIYKRSAKLSSASSYLFPCLPCASSHTYSFSRTQWFYLCLLKLVFKMVILVPDIAICFLYPRERMVLILPARKTSAICLTHSKSVIPHLRIGMLN